ncbi:hypothetical protein S40293_00617 [Stachybotrys chartarum IBT 40293]|nr:hypothetical protein S40293_00617 [Stachybotrys chartarum IBT 40293]
MRGGAAQPCERKPPKSGASHPRPRIPSGEPYPSPFSHTQSEGHGYMSPTLEPRDKPGSRRVHTKSRTGCRVCKRRRVKCDEGRPICRNCAVGERPCSYGPDKSPDTRLAGTPAGPSSFSSSPGSATSLMPGSELAPLGIRTRFTALHMVLLYHAITDMASLMKLEGDMHPIIARALGSAHTDPYVLDQLLALAALHRSTLDPDAAAMFRHEATELQTRALGMFNETRDSISEATFIPSFLFASFVGVHILYNTLSDHQPTVGGFIGGFVNYMRIHRGIRAVTSRYWDDLLRSDLKPLLYVTQWMEEAEPPSPGTETAHLRTYLESTSGPSTPSTNATLEALRWMQWVLDLKAQVSPTSSTLGLAIHVVMAWPLIVPDEYVENLYQHQPEALVVLAFWGAALHQHRDFWVFGNAGSTLVQLIAAHIGPFWTDALAWPHAVIAKDRPES